jgi:hypothetical protein
MERRIAVVGDHLSSGGYILPAEGSPFTFMEHQVALIGGQAFCAACKSNGVIAKAGGPYRMEFIAEVALDGDIVLCKCDQPPKIVAVLSGESWCDDGSERSGSVSSALTATGAVISVVTGKFDERVEATIDGPAGYPYYVETEDGRVFQGRLCATGKLPRIHTGDRPNDYTVYWGDEAIAKQHGD